MPQPQDNSTGIIGTITGFGSIIVNGIHIHFPPNMMVNTIMGPIPARNLRIGQVVAVETQTISGRKVAQAMTMRHALAGPVEAVDPQNQTIRIMSQTVRVPDPALFAQAQRSSAIPYGGIRPGQVVVVSGLRNGRVVEASRIDAAPHRNFAAMSGTVTGLGNGFVEVDGISVQMSGPPPVGFEVGRDVVMAGRTVNGVFNTEATSTNVQPVEPFNGRMRYVVAEAYPQRIAQKQLTRIGRIAVPARAIAPGQRTVVFAERNRKNSYTALSANHVTPNALQTGPRANRRGVTADGSYDYGSAVAGSGLSDTASGLGGSSGAVGDGPSGAGHDGPDGRGPDGGGHGGGGPDGGGPGGGGPGGGGPGGNP